MSKRDRDRAKASKARKERTDMFVRKMDEKDKQARAEEKEA